MPGMTNSFALRLAAILGLLGVALGAFGAHGLHGLLERNQTTSVWEKAVFYHLIHAVVLFVLAGRAPLRIGAWLSLLTGILLFSGSLYLLAVTKIHWLGYITPFGGISFLAGWLCLAIVPPAETLPPSKLANVLPKRD
jgi:uncharacterized membrane protein YgdD (TMEM256/DUF423 family)